MEVFVKTGKTVFPLEPCKFLIRREMVMNLAFFINFGHDRGKRRKKSGNPFFIKGKGNFHMSINAY